MSSTLNRTLLHLLAAGSLVAGLGCSQAPKGGETTAKPADVVKQEPPPAPAPAAPDTSADLGGGVTTAQLSQAIRDHVAASAASNGGAYVVPDAVTGNPLTLVLDKVHDDRLSGVGNDTYFACSDFKEASGKTWDVDFWVAAHEGALAVTQTLVHKEDGVARYSWVEENGTWRTDPPQPTPEPAAAADAPAEHPEGAEHPEHPEK